MGLFTTIKRFFGIKSGTDRTLRCEDCKKSFIFDEGEQRFFAQKGFTDPKRCPKCRKRAKFRMQRKPQPRRGGSSGSSGSNGNGQQRRFRRGRRHSLIDGHSPYADE